MRYAVALLACLAVLVVGAGTARAQWPTTCVQANDAFEHAAGRFENVGIYQRVHGYGPRAEAACQNDHRNAIRASFGWAFGVAPPVQEQEPRIDPTLQRAWDLMIGEGIMQRAAQFPGASMVTVRWTNDLPSNATGVYLPGEHMILMNVAFQWERPEAIAAALAHEFWHAVSPIQGRNAFDRCIADEVWAVSHQAAVWGGLYSGSPHTALERTLERMWDIALYDVELDLPFSGLWEDVASIFPNLTQYVLYDLGYAQTCAT